MSSFVDGDDSLKNDATATGAHPDSTPDLTPAPLRASIASGSSPMETSFSSRCWSLAKALVPYLIILWPAWVLCRWISRDAINAPFLDDYMSVPLFDKAAHHQLTAHDFFAAQMEHRIAWVRVVQLAFHKAWPRHLWIAQVWYNWVLLVVTLVNVGVLLRQSGLQPFRRHWPLTALASLCLFSPVQFNIILWPFMHQVVSLAFFLTTALIVWRKNWPAPLRFFLGLFCALAATLSFTAGFLVWVVLLPVMVWNAPMPSGTARKVIVAAWILALLVTAGFYFHDLKNEVGGDYAMGQGETATLGRDLREFANDPLKAARYAARILGSPLMRGSTLDLMQSSLVSGVVLLSLFAFCLGWWLWRIRDGDFRRRMLPWLAMGAYAVGTAIAITMGRVWIGISGAYALSTRYVIHATPLVIALPVLLWLIAEDVSQRYVRTQRWLPRILAVAGTALAMLHLPGWAYGGNMMEAWSSSRKRGASSTRFFKSGCVVENCYPDTPSPDYLLADQLHLLDPPMLTSRRLEEIPASPHPLSETFAAWSSLRITNGTGIAEGRAILKQRWRPVDAIVFARQIDVKHWEIFHVAQVTALPLYLSNMIVRDLEFMYQPPDGVYQNLSTFSAHFDLKRLPQGKSIVAAWAYDYDVRRVSLIPGAFEIDTETGRITPLGNDPASVQLSAYVPAPHQRRGG